ncbi:cutinase-domain-containing protein [Mycena haematopus]|nr:cutinase-domain-containing protein [Mycena haematopus]
MAIPITLAFLFMSTCTTAYPHTREVFGLQKTIPRTYDSDSAPKGLNVIHGRPHTSQPEDYVVRPNSRSSGASVVEYQIQQLASEQDKRGLFEVGSGASSGCSDVIVIYARGTSESAPIGDIVGPPLNASLEKSIEKTLTFAGVDYPADYGGFFEGGSPIGSETMAQDLTNAANNCPNASIVSVGYSQGAQLVHNSAKMLTEEISRRIKAVVTFGDPYKDQPVEQIPADDVDIICHPLDVVCFGSDLVDSLILLFLENHLDYYLDVDAAAEFIAERV